MTRLLAIICVFLIVIGLYAHWRYPRIESADPGPVSTAVSPEPEAPAPEDATADTGDPVTPRGKERSLDR